VREHRAGPSCPAETVKHFDLAARRHWRGDVGLCWSGTPQFAPAVPPSDNARRRGTVSARRRVDVAFSTRHRTTLAIDGWMSRLNPGR
jgi:hypothetical protein